MTVDGKNINVKNKSKEIYDKIEEANYRRIMGTTLAQKEANKEEEEEASWGFITNSNRVAFFGVLVLVIVLAGLLNIKQEVIPIRFIYYYGFIIFMIGILAASLLPLFIFFVYPFCLIGLGLMVATPIAIVFQNPYMTDNPKYIFMYFAIMVIFLLVAFVKKILYAVRNLLKPDLRKVDGFLIFYTIVIALSQILPYIADRLANMQ